MMNINKSFLRRLVMLVAVVAGVLLPQSVVAQTIKGSVTDAITGEALIGAAVKVAELKDAGGITNIDGEFSITITQPGRYTIETSYMGYEPSVLKEVLVAGAKDVVLDITLRESSTDMNEVVIKPRVNKESTVNPTALVGGMMLSMEEASRYAGGYNDPARLVTAFAGVAGQGDGNGISVHGNAPQFMQYRLEGVEIFSPNHFADLYSAGFGMVSALNSNVITNSDFFVSTFNSSYNNALSGVFDVRMRAGNNSKFENGVQVGSVGIEWTSEGPISKKNNSSFIFNYRYGFSTIARKLKLIDTYGSQYDFQDLSFKLNFPTKKAGTFSAFALGFIDKSWDVELDIKDIHSIYDASDQEGSLYNALLGASHKIHFDNKWTWRTTAAYNMQHNKVDMEYWGLNFDANHKPIGFEGKDYPFSYLKQNEDRAVFNTELSKQVTPRWLLQLGGEYSHRFFDLNFRTAENVYEPVSPTPYYATKDNTGLASIFWSNLWKPADNLSFNIGLSGSYFLLSKDFSIEPRASMKWEPGKRHSISLGYGLHSMIEKLDAYFFRNADGTMANKDLGLSKAHHLLTTYMYKFTDNLNLRFNAYYQYGFDTPVGINGSTFCTVNRLFNYIEEPLVNEGNTRNYGADITLEHYMSRGFYGQVNGSLFKSEYRGLDKKWRNQLYDRGYMVKVLGGKEWMIGKRKQDVFNVSVKYTLQGGLRHTPIDVDAMKANVAAGIINDQPIYKEDEAMTLQFDPTSILDLTVSYKINRKNVGHTIAFEGVNILQHETPYAVHYDLGTGQLRVDKSGISLPNIYYRIDF
ncbi:MAG: TonB-dependent receptor [Bacteroidaceae bacterium]|nr:TonB-dependent receptor [Bacteroidaceae bacterium]